MVMPRMKQLNNLVDDFSQVWDDFFPPLPRAPWYQVRKGPPVQGAPRGKDKAEQPQGGRVCGAAGRRGSEAGRSHQEANLSSGGHQGRGTVVQTHTQEAE